MKKAIMMSLSVVVALSASSIDEAFNTGKVSGHIRAAYVSQDNMANLDTYGTSIGGILKFETADWDGIKLGVAAHISQKIDVATNDDKKVNLDFLDEEGRSFTSLGEAYLDYTFNDLNLRIGRQLIDTPFADTDDIRMHPNTFEAAIITYSLIENMTLVGGYVTRWAGYDSGDDKSTFKKLDPNGNGAIVVGAVNESIEHLALQGWYYGVDNVADMVYTDASYVIHLSETMEFDISAQYAQFNEKSGSAVDGNVFGISAAFNASALNLGIAYNQGNNDNSKTTPIGFGGGPYMTSMEEWTIEAMSDVKAYQLRAEFDMASAGLEGLILTALYGNFKSDTDGTKVTEFDVIASLELNEVISGDVSYAIINDKNNNADGGIDAGYDRFLVRLNYAF